jgi:hypothetical protein
MMVNASGRHLKSSSAICKAVTSLQAPTSDWQIYPARILYTTGFHITIIKCNIIE